MASLSVAATVFDAVASLLRINIDLADEFRRTFTGESAIAGRSAPYRAVQKITIDMITAAGYDALALAAQPVLVGLAVAWETRSARAATGTTTQLSVTTTTTTAAAGSDRAQADQEARHA